MTTTVNVAVTELVLPALSRAVADSVVDAANVKAGPDAVGQVLVARPESPSDAAHVMATVWSTV